MINALVVFKYITGNFGPTGCIGRHTKRKEVCEDKDYAPNAVKHQLTLYEKRNHQMYRYIITN